MTIIPLFHFTCRSARKRFDCRWQALKLQQEVQRPPSPTPASEPTWPSTWTCPSHADLHVINLKDLGQRSKNCCCLKIVQHRSLERQESSSCKAWSTGSVKGCASGTILWEQRRWDETTGHNAGRNQESTRSEALFTPDASCIAFLNKTKFSASQSLKHLLQTLTQSHA